MSWVDKYRTDQERSSQWTVSKDGSKVYCGDGRTFKRTVLPSIAERKADLDLVELDEDNFVQEIDASELNH